jgi:hexosaminidase
MLSILAATNSSINDLLFDFVNATHTTLRSAGKIPVVWEEVVLGRDSPLKNDTIILNWISSKNVRAVIDRGYRVIHAASDYFYLDCGMGGWLGKNPQGNSWCDPFKTWSKVRLELFYFRIRLQSSVPSLLQIYSFDPFEGFDASQHSQVLGGETLAWSEQIDPTNLDSLVW